MRHQEEIEIDPDTPTAMVEPETGAEVIRFDPFSLYPSRHLLLEGDRPVRLGSRALEILLLLLESAGDFVSNAEIFRRVWPRTVVVEGNLRVHVAGLRKALGDGRDGRRYIVNSPSRGYSFVAPVLRTRATPLPEASKAPLGSRRLPLMLNRLIGQEVTLEFVRTQLTLHRMVTLIGTGGIGKTSVALAVATQLLDAPITQDGVCWVDLASVAQAELVPSSVAAALGLASVSQDGVRELLVHLSDRRVLIVLDNCEHVVEAVAQLTEQLLRGAPEVRLLATSREPLRAAGEWIHRLTALRLPPHGEPMAAAEALRYAGVELFVERLAAARDDFVLQDTDAQAVVRICRRLDGIPLAIELAAARAASVGTRAVADALEESLTLLNKGRRTAIARHQTLRATLDWSYRLLSPVEQRTLVCLSVFAGAFTMSSAHAVADGLGMAQNELLEVVLELVEKSLITADISGEEACFRLFETTRAYGLERLRQDRDHALILRQHARHCLDLLVEAEQAWKDAPFEPWLSQYGRRIDDVRAALRWSFSPEGDQALCVALTAKAGLLFFQLSLADEHRRFAEQALALAHQGIDVDARWKFELNVVYGHMLYHTVGLPPERDQALQRARELAEQIGEPRMKALACSTDWMAAYQVANSHDMLRHARAFETLTAGETDLAWTHMYDRMKAPAYHFHGLQDEARACCERGLKIQGIVRPPFISGSQINLRVSHGTLLARVLWLQGKPRQAEQMASETIQAALEEGESVALAFLLAISACPIAIWSGDWDLARERVNMLLSHARKHALTPWRHYGMVYKAMIDWHDAGEPDAGPLIDLPARPTPPLVELMATLHPRLVGPQIEERVERGLGGWCHAEVLRARGILALAADAAGAEALFRQALDKATQDATPAWALRSASDLARLHLIRGRRREAVEALAPVLKCFEQGQETVDVRNARSLLQTARSRATSARGLPEAALPPAR